MAAVPLPQIDLATGLLPGVRQVLSPNYNARPANVVPELLATRRDLEQVADGNQDAGVLSGWRRSVLGERLLAAL